MKSQTEMFNAAVESLDTRLAHDLDRLDALTLLQVGQVVYGSHDADVLALCARLDLKGEFRKVPTGFISDETWSQ